MNALDLDRFESRMEPEPMSGCWLWWGSDTGRKTGYGLISIGGRQTLAHRLSYEHFIGPIPEGRQIDHKCRVRCCVNPQHLQIVTAVENRLLMAVRRTHCKNGQVPASGEPT